MKPRNKRLSPILLALILLVALAIVFQRRMGTNQSGKTLTTGSTPGMQRENVRIIYTKHARCRMACRWIDETEVAEVLKEGVINQAKSKAGGSHPQFALEAMTDDGQQVRIVFAPEKGQVVVITCIDLRKEWPCDCD